MRELLVKSFRAAVAAADPLHVLPAHLPPPPRGRVFVAAAGKAAASMAVAAEKHFAAAHFSALEGIAITRYGHGLPTRRIRVVEAGHPVPDVAGETAAREIFARTKELEESDLLLALLSGGGSSLLAFPIEGLGMAELKKLTGQLLKSGAAIQEINTVRKHLSAIQGGRLAAASRAQVLALIISDVTGDEPTHIASGPCTPDPTTIGDAKAVLAKYGIDFHGPFSESPKPGDPVFSKTTNLVVATARRSLDAAAEVFRRQGIRPVILGDTITGEAREVGREMAELARRTRREKAGPTALISGGECTVTVTGEGGRGGRCCEFLLSLGIETGGIWAIAADTDGIDGTEDNAGAILTPDSMSKGPEAKAYLARHDSYGFFSALGDLVVTGPTRTNVNDYRAILIT